jgi:hypothetical protein
MAAIRCLQLLSYRSLQLLLLSLAHKRRLSGKCLLKMAEEVGHVRPVPHAAPIS